MKKINAIIMNFIDNLNKTQKIFASLVFLFVMVFLVNFISNLSFKDTFIDYKNSTAEELIQSKPVVTDRDIYLILNVITENFLNTKIDNYFIDGKKVGLKDFYNYALYQEFKYNMSYGKFKNKVNLFYDKIFIENTNYDEIPLEKVIDEIYLYSEPRNMYIVKINTNTENSGYIGIELDNSLKKYTIFYIE